MSDNKEQEQREFVATAIPSPRSPPVEFGILPHPAKTNNPADLQSDPKEHGGLQGAGANAYTARGPHVPSQEIAEGLEKPKTRDEVSAALPLESCQLTPQLKAEAAKLN
jgi:hypothetical protein